MTPVIAVSRLSKTYASGFAALRNVDLEIRRGEIFALLGPNGAGKTTLINIICGIVNKSSGSVLVDGYDIVKDYRAARSLIGLVPQELVVNDFERIWGTVSFSCGLFGKRLDPAQLINSQTTSPLREITAAYGIFAMIHRSHCQRDAPLHHDVVDGIDCEFGRSAVQSAGSPFNVLTAHACPANATRIPLQFPARLLQSARKSKPSFRSTLLLEFQTP